MYTTRQEFTEALLRKKAELGLTYEQMAASAGKPAVMMAAYILGQMKPDAEVVDHIKRLLNLVSEDDSDYWFSRLPDRGNYIKNIIKDPFQQRLLEVISVYGEALKQTSYEKFGDGVMSTANFSVDISKVEDPNDPDADIVNITMTGKFEPFKPILQSNE